MKIFLKIAALSSWFFGLATMLAPGPFYAPAGVQMTPQVATIAEAQGAILIGLGVILWRIGPADAHGLRAVLSGGLVIQVLSLGVVLRTLWLGAGLAMLPGILIHVVMGALYFYYLLTCRAAPGTDR